VKKLFKFFSFIFISLFVVLSTFIHSGKKIADTYRTNNFSEKRERFLKTKEEIEEKLNLLDKDIKEKERSLDDVSTQIKILQEQIDQINLHSSKLEQESMAKQKEIEYSNQKIEQDLGLLAKKIKVLDMIPAETLFELFSSSSTLSDIFSKLSMMYEIVCFTGDLVNRLRAEAERVKVQQTELNEYFEAVRFEHSVVQIKKDELEKIKINNAKECEDLRNEREGVETEKDKIEDELKALYSHGSTVASRSYNSQTEIGTFSPPLSNYKIGMRFGDNGGKHRGVDFLACYGDEICAVADGVVIQVNNSGYGSGWGLYVTIDHGSGYATRYAHMSVIVVQVGQRVLRGDVIGYVGSTGDSSCPHLHLELLKDGERRDILSRMFP
jgi:murein DD-endopeptidase MepM/ murein hydrolase activator NlpD